MIKVQKGNSQYTIDEKELQSYKLRGFEVVMQEEKALTPKEALLKRAEELGIAVPDNATKAEIETLIKAAAGE